MKVGGSESEGDINQLCCARVDIVNTCLKVNVALLQACALVEGPSVLGTEEDSGTAEREV